MKRLNAKQTSANTAELVIYGEIGNDLWGDGVTAKDVLKSLRGLDDSVSSIRVMLNSIGGSVTEGLAIYDLLKREPRTISVEIDGIAASAASVIALAGSTVGIAENAMMMIHNAWGIVMGNKDDMRETADLLEKFDERIVSIYRAKTDQDVETIIAAMNVETWFDAQEAVDWGLADAILSASEAAAKIGATFDLSRFNRVPKSLKYSDGMGADIKEQMRQQQDVALQLRRVEIDYERYPIVTT